MSIADLALSFDESRAASTELLVAGNAFYPRMLADIEGDNTVCRPRDATASTDLLRLAGRVRPWDLRPWRPEL